MFVSLNPVTKGMKADAASAGTFTIINMAGKKKKYSLIQILTIQEILKGKRPDLPFPDTAEVYKKAVEVVEGVQGDLAV